MMNVRVHFHVDWDYTPKVYAPEFIADPPHRNPDKGWSLCLWYPRDPVDKRWLLTDGLGELFLMARPHLLREHHWHQSAALIADRVWPGEEEDHGYPEDRR